MVLTLIIAWILIFFGIVVGAGGVRLAVLGGSWAYGIAAGAMAHSAQRWAIRWWPTRLSEAL